jgi:hypothetical protein
VTKVQNCEVQRPCDRDTNFRSCRYSTVHHSHHSTPAPVGSFPVGALWLLSEITPDLQTTSALFTSLNACVDWEVSLSTRYGFCPRSQHIFGQPVPYSHHSTPASTGKSPKTQVAHAAMFLRNIGVNWKLLCHRNMVFDWADDDFKLSINPPSSLNTRDMKKLLVQHLDLRPTLTRRCLSLSLCHLLHRCLSSQSKIRPAIDVRYTRYVGIIPSPFRDKRD